MTTGHYSKTQEFYKCKCFSIFHPAFGPLKQFRFIIRGVARNCYLSIIKPWSLIFKFNFQAQLSRSLFAKIVAQNFSIYHAMAFRYWFSFNPICDALNVPKLVVTWLLDCWWGEELEDIKGNELGPSTLMSFIIGSAATGIVNVF